MNVYDALMKVGLDMKFAHVDTISSNSGIGQTNDSTLLKIIQKREFEEGLMPEEIWEVNFRNKQKEKTTLIKYRQESKKIFEILRRFCEVVEKGGTDEAFLDVTN